MSKERKAAWRIAGGAACTMMVAAAPFCVGVAQAADYNFYGDVSMALSWNMQNTLKENKPSAAGNLGGQTLPLPDTKGDMSMERFTARLNLDSKVNDTFSWAGKVRLVREMPLGYLDTLQNLKPTPIPAANGAVNVMHHNDLASWLSKSELRELYADINFTDNVMLRFGKQQVAWGESDFFAAMDMVHGFDWTWRSFLEPANEDLRKPLVLANLSVKVPELDGKIQVLLRPGKLNKLDSIGNSLDFQGGRWMPQPLKGIDFQAVTPWNYEANGANARDNTWGIRW
ncbi:MAG: LysR family transcriptional regulator, partial [Proteobacteria bacterium]|nr:LysR family transcriptional regulator [Pseudomonadota bacterium]